jgi:hypothetical protein
LLVVEPYVMESPSGRILQSPVVGHGSKPLDAPESPELLLEVPELLDPPELLLELVLELLELPLDAPELLELPLDVPELLLETPELPVEPVELPLAPLDVPLVPPEPPPELEEPPASAPESLYAPLVPVVPEPELVPPPTGSPAVLLAPQPAVVTTRKANNALRWSMTCTSEQGCRRSASPLAVAARGGIRHAATSFVRGYPSRCYNRDAWASG